MDPASPNNAIAYVALVNGIINFVLLIVLAYKCAHVSVVDTIEFKSMQPATKAAYDRDLLPLIHDVVGEIPPSSTIGAIMCKVIEMLHLPKGFYSRHQADVDRACGAKFRTSKFKMG